MKYRKDSTETPEPTGPHTRLGLAAARLRLAWRSWWRHRGEEYDAARAWLDGRLGLAFFLCLGVGAVALIAGLNAAFESIDRGRAEDCKAVCSARGSPDGFVYGSCMCVLEGGGAVRWNEYTEATR